MLSGCESPPGLCLPLLRAVVPFYPVSDRLVVAAQINRRPSIFLLDTGATTNVLTHAAARRLGLRTERVAAGSAFGVGGSRPVSIVRADDVRIGTLHVSGLNFVAGDVFGSERTSIDGLLSTNPLSLFDLDLDYPARRLGLYVGAGNCQHPTAALDPPLFAVPLLPRLFPSIQPRIMVSIAGHALPAMIDTGAPYNVVFAATAMTLGLHPDDLRTNQRTVVTGIGPNRVTAIRHVLEAVTVGDLTIENMPVEIIDDQAPPGISVVLGLDFARRVHLWFSHSSGMLSIQYPPGPPPCDRRNPDVGAAVPAARAR